MATTVVSVAVAGTIGWANLSVSKALTEERMNNMRQDQSEMRLSIIKLTENEASIAATQKQMADKLEWLIKERNDAFLKTVK